MSKNIFVKSINSVNTYPIGLTSFKNSILFCQKHTAHTLHLTQGLFDDYLIPFYIFITFILLSKLYISTFTGLVTYIYVINTVANSIVT